MNLSQLIEEAYIKQKNLEEFDVSPNNESKSFLKGALTAGTLAAFLGSPESVEATKNALSSAAENVSDFFHNTGLNLKGSGTDENNSSSLNDNYSSNSNSSSLNDTDRIYTNLAKQGFYKDLETGAWINPNTHQVYTGNLLDKTIDTDKLDNIINKITFKTNHPILSQILSYSDSVLSKPLSHPFLIGTTLGGTGLLAGGLARRYLLRRNKNN